MAVGFWSEMDESADYTRFVSGHPALPEPHRAITRSNCGKSEGRRGKGKTVCRQWFCGNKSVFPGTSRKNRQGAPFSLPSSPFTGKRMAFMRLPCLVEKQGGLQAAKGVNFHISRFTFLSSFLASLIQILRRECAAGRLPSATGGPGRRQWLCPCRPHRQRCLRC